jgi:hypothetical protein
MATKNKYVPGAGGPIIIINETVLLSFQAGLITDDNLIIKH